VALLASLSNRLIARATTQHTALTDLNRVYCPQKDHNNNNIRLIRRCQNATCYNDMDRTVKKHKVTEVLDYILDITISLLLLLEATKPVCTILSPLTGMANQIYVHKYTNKNNYKSNTMMIIVTVTKVYTCTLGRSTVVSHHRPHLNCVTTLWIKVHLRAIFGESCRVELFAQRHRSAEFAARFLCIIGAFVSEEV